MRPALTLPRHCAAAPYGGEAEPLRGERHKSTTFRLNDCEARSVLGRERPNYEAAYSTDTILNLIFAEKANFNFFSGSASPDHNWINAVPAGFLDRGGWKKTALSPAIQYAGVRPKQQQDHLD